MTERKHKIIKQREKWSSYSGVYNNTGAPTHRITLKEMQHIRRQEKKCDLVLVSLCKGEMVTTLALFHNRTVCGKSIRKKNHSY